MPPSPVFSGQPPVHEYAPAIGWREFKLFDEVLRLQGVPLVITEYFTNLWPPL